MAVKYNLVAKNGEYKDKNGDTKARWIKIGVVMETKTGGLAAKLETIPLNWDGFANLAEPDLAPVKEMAKGNAYQAQPLDEMDSDIPF